MLINYVPKDWRLSPDGARRYRDHARLIDGLVVRKAAKYHHLPGASREDLMQEGRIAALYAVDSYDPARGRLEGYVSICVERAMAMIARALLRRMRTPHRQELTEEGWVSVPQALVGLDEAPEVGRDSEPIISSELIVEIGKGLEAVRRDVGWRRTIVQLGHSSKAEWLRQLIKSGYSQAKARVITGATGGEASRAEFQVFPERRGKTPPRPGTIRARTAGYQTKAEWLRSLLANGASRVEAGRVVGANSGEIAREVKRLRLLAKKEERCSGYPSVPSAT